MPWEREREADVRQTAAQPEREAPAASPNDAAGGKRESVNTEKTSVKVTEAREEDTREEDTREGDQGKAILASVLLLILIILVLYLIRKAAQAQKTE